MKWLTYFSTGATILLIGYWLGTSHQQPQQKPEQKSELSIPAETKLTNQEHGKATVAPEPKKASSLLADTAPPPEKPTVRFILHLENRDYISAMSLFTDIWNNKPSAIPTLKELYITHIQQLLNQPQKNSAQINNAIQAYLSDFYDDTEILLLLAGQYAYTNNFYDMLNTMQLSTNYAYTATQKGIIDKAYSELILYTDTLLSEQQQWQALISVYLHSENTGLLREQDTLRLVELYIAQDNTYLAFDYAEKLENKPQWKKQLADLLPKTQVKEVGEDLAQAAINLQKVADQFIIVIQISGNDTTLLIDTGASITTLSKAYFESIQRRSQFTFRQKQTFLTANGETTGEIYTVDEFQIGQYLLPNVDIAVIDFPTSPHSSGLLGMNVLRDFKFEIDQKNALLTLEKNAP